MSSPKPTFAILFASLCGSSGLGLGGVLELNRDLDVLIGKVHLGGEGAVRLPPTRGTGGGLLQHLVDLLEGEALGLRDEDCAVELILP